MIPFLQDYAERLTVLHADLRQTCVDLPDPALDWSPGPGMNSMGVLLAHSAGLRAA